MNEVEAVADDNEGKLIGEFGFLEEVFDFLGIVEVALPADTFDFADLPCARGGLDVFEVNFRILAEVDNRAEVVIQSLMKRSEEPKRKSALSLPSKLLNDSNISINFTGPRISEYFVAICTTTWRFWRMLMRSISCRQAIDCSVVSLLK